MRLTYRIILLLIFVISVRSAFSQDKLILYRWRGSQGELIGTIKLPENFQVVKSWEYGEGIVTTLKWKDSSMVILHFGGLMRLPLLGLPEYKAIDSTQTKDGKIWNGKNRDGMHYWKECSLFGGWYNIAYDHVPTLRKDLFDRAFNTFVPVTTPRIDKH